MAPWLQRVDTSVEFIILVVTDSMFILFGFYFIIVFLGSRKSFKQHHSHLQPADAALLQKFRFLLFILCILGLSTPFRFYLAGAPHINAPSYVSYILFAFNAFFELLLMMLMVIASRRIFRAYYKLVNSTRSRVRIPWYYTLVLLVYFWSWILKEALYTLLVFELQAIATVMSDLWNIYLYVFGVVFLLLAMLLLSTCCQLNRYYRGLKIQKEITPLNGHEHADMQLFKRLRNVSIGFVLYCANAVSVVVWLLIKAVHGKDGDDDVTKDARWQIQFNFVGHLLALLSFWCYVRPWKIDFLHRESLLKPLHHRHQQKLYTMVMPDEDGNAVEESVNSSSRDQSVTDLRVPSKTK